ncbi:ATP-binding cassette domain-containing protein [Candidatus Micrarchaeota archaeon]|nr:ATP-binding cassette domain-containing protein [Candidatus Micrarchaeota archaeon]
MDYDIIVENVVKSYVKRVPGTGIRRIFPKKEKVRAVDDVSFRVKRGEFFAYVGANGSGKTTTIKMLTGILIPESGSVRCLGFVPHKQRIKYVKNIGVVFGQKSLLWWDLPVIESLKLYKDIYEVSDADFKERLAYYDKILAIGKLLDKQVRKLSFGERMRCEVAASLLHKPKILFLDEPTVGMDVVAKEEMRNFLREINEKEGTTIMLTTHDMGDIEALCKRIILLDNGRVIYDGLLSDLKKKYVHSKNITIIYSGFKDKKFADEGLKKVGVIKHKDGYIRMSVDLTKHDIKKVISDIIKAVEVVDISVEEPELSEIVSKIYKAGKVQ